MLLIFALLAANIVAALARHGGLSAPAPRTAPHVMARPTVENPSARVAFGNGLSTGQENSTALQP
jgi:hypothetical protein